MVILSHYLIVSSRDKSPNPEEVWLVSATKHATQEREGHVVHDADSWVPFVKWHHPGESIFFSI